MPFSAVFGSLYLRGSRECGSAAHGVQTGCDTCLHFWDWIIEAKIKTLFSTWNPFLPSTARSLLVALQNFLGFGLPTGEGVREKISNRNWILGINEGSPGSSGRWPSASQQVFYSCPGCRMSWAGSWPAVPRIVCPRMAWMWAALLFVCVCVYVCAEERVNEKCIYARWVMVHFRVSIMGSNYRCRIIGVRREIGAPVQE